MDSTFHAFEPLEAIVSQLRECPNYLSDTWYAVLPDGDTSFAYMPSAGTTVVTAPLHQAGIREYFTGKVPHQGDYCYRFLGQPDREKRLAKTLAISRSGGDTYMVNAWGRGRRSRL